MSEEDYRKYPSFLFYAVLTEYVSWQQVPAGVDVVVQLVTVGLHECQQLAAVVILQVDVQPLLHRRVGPLQLQTYRISLQECLHLSKFKMPYRNTISGFIFSNVMERSSKVHNSI